MRFARWRNKGAGKLATAWRLRHKHKLLHTRQRQAQVDSTSIRAHQPGTGAQKNGEQALGRSRGGNTSKLHPVADGAGQVLGWCVTVAPGRRRAQAAELPAPELAPAQAVVADAAYDRNAVRDVLAEAGAVAVIMKKVFLLLLFTSLHCLAPAQAPGAGGPEPEPGPTSVPPDGGASVLLAGGMVYGICADGECDNSAFRAVSESMYGLPVLVLVVQRRLQKS